MRILILNYHLQAYTGSEINALQLGRALKDLGHSVDAATFITGSPIKDRFDETGLRVINLLENSPSTMDYDLIWAHHEPVLTHLLYKWNVQNTKILFSSLGPHEPLESPPLYFDDIPVFLTNSFENKKCLMDHGIGEEKIYFFPNYAPERFFNQARASQASEICKIAIVSNHPPQEITDFAKLASDKGVHVDLIGFQGEQKFVDEALLLSYDLVISIGKTVQYCFALKVPVYCYDRFGGPGFITPDHFFLAGEHNFSGRGFDRKLSAEELYDDIFSDTQRASETVDFLYEKSREKYCLETNIQKLLERMRTAPVTGIAAIKDRSSVLERINDAHVNELKNRLRANDEIELRGQIIQNLYGELDKMNQAIQGLFQDLSKMDSAIKGLYGDLGVRDQTINNMHQELAARDQTINNMHQELVAREQTINNMHEERTAHDRMLHELSQSLSDRDHAIQGLGQQLAAREQAFEQKDQQLSAMTNSKAWRFASFLQRLRVKIAPERSPQFRLLRFFYRRLSKRAN